MWTSADSLKYAKYDPQFSKNKNSVMIEVLQLPLKISKANFLAKKLNPFN